MKKAAPAKESGLHSMQSDTNSFDMTAHEAFMMNDLLPMVVGYARSNNHPTEAAALAALAAMVAILSTKGYTVPELSNFVAVFAVTHDAPEGLQ
ncbi:MULTISPECIES: hypothetical protein [Pseudomonadaceae]|uniref:Uncharacterized protein n=1 Tax=Pseudomonas jinjuensis TaxID=198616 RepID=A0A1H0FNT3_9PSED|nr:MULTISPECIES: hypothetical protein [Pseudomonadaceae]SDN96358.1 hypothetical protein SAMN05216193_106277 [Pseudomonas jinjuensis]